MPEVLWLLIAVVLILGLAYLFTRYVAGNQRLTSQRGRKTKMLHIVEQVYMGRERQIVLVQAGEKYFLLGNTPNQITTLAEFTAEEVAVWCDAQQQTGEEKQAPNFAQSLQEILKRGRRDNGD